EESAYLTAISYQLERLAVDVQAGEFVTDEARESLGDLMLHAESALASNAEAHARFAEAVASSGPLIAPGRQDASRPFESIADASGEGNESPASDSASRTDSDSFGAQ